MPAAPAPAVASRAKLGLLLAPMSGWAKHLDAGASAALAAAAGAVIIGFAPIAVRISELGPQATNFWRFAFAAPVLFAAALMSARAPSPREAGALAFAGVLFGVEIGLWAAALGYTTVVNATLFSNMTPIIAAAAGVILFRERLNSPMLLAGAAAIIGAALLAFGRAEAGAGPTGRAGLGWVGDGLGLASAFGYAGYLLIVRAIGVRVSVAWVMAIATTTAGLTAACGALVRHETFLPATARGWLLLAVLGLGVQIFGQGLIAYGVGRLPVAASTVLLWFQPLTGALLAWLIFGESLGPLGLVGASMILGGVYAVQRYRTR